MENYKLLTELGFTNSQAKVYLNLVKKQKCSAIELANNSKISSSKIYEILNKLIEKGLASEIKEKNKKYFYSTSPSQLNKILSKKEEKLKSLKKNIKTLNQDFEKINKNKKEFVKVFKGLNGIKSSMNIILENLQESKTHYVFVSPMTPKDFNYFYEYDRQRINKKIKLKIIYSKNSNIESIKKIQKKDPKYFFPRIISIDFDTKTVFNLFGDYTLIIIWQEEPTSILIYNQESTNSLKEYFNHLWTISKEI